MITHTLFYINVSFYYDYENEYTSHAENLETGKNKGTLPVSLPPTHNCVNVFFYLHLGQLLYKSMVTPLRVFCSTLLPFGHLSGTSFTLINIILPHDLMATWHYLIWMCQREAISYHLPSRGFQVFIIINNAAMSVLWYNCRCSQAGLFPRDNFLGVTLSVLAETRVQ